MPDTRKPQPPEQDNLLAELQKLKDENEALRKKLSHQVFSRNSNLLETEQKFKNLFDHASDAIFILEPDTLSIIDANQKALKDSGFQKEELMDITLWDLMSEKGVKLSYGKPEHLKRQGQLLYESEHRYSSGKHIPVEISARYVPYDDRYVFQYFVRDISERKEVEKKIRQSEDKFHKTFEESPLGIAIVSLDGRYLDVNQRLCEMTGYSKKEITSQTILDFSHPEDAEKDRVLSRMVFKKEIPFFRMEKRYLKKSGDYFWGRLYATVIRDENDHPIYGLGMIEDIDESKAAKEKIKENEEWFRAIFNASRDSFAVELEKKIVYINKSFEHLFGYSKSEILNKSIADLLPEEDRQLILNYHQGNSEGKDVSDFFEVKGIHKSGHTFDLEISASTLIIRGKKFNISLLRDITERHKAEEKLKSSNQELKKINSELDRFVYSVSHDLRAPLVSVLGLINLAKVEKDNENKAKYVDMMEGSVKKLDNFIQDIINYSRNARTVIKKEKINCEQIANEGFECMQYLEGADSISKIIEVDNNLTFRSDPSRLKIVLNNLISNAVRFHRKDIERPFIAVRFKQADPDHIKIEVEDNGLGIHREHVDKIFEMFYRAEDSIQGSGLGLYIVKETVEKLGGTITVSSEVNKGTIFTIMVKAK